MICARKMLGILPVLFMYICTFYTYMHVSSWLKYHREQFPGELEKINFKIQRNCANTGKTSSSVSFEQYFQEFRHLVLYEMISFEKIHLK